MGSSLKKVLNRIYLVLTLIWVVVIFSFSLQPGDVSSDISGSFLQKILEWFMPSGWEQMELWHTVLRKCAHFTEFFVLGVLIHMALLDKKFVRRFALAILFCVAVASMDETIQLFVDGRAGRVVDVMIDTFGSLTGILMVHILLNLRKTRRV